MWESRKEKRVNRFESLREQLIDEIVDYKIGEIEKRKKLIDSGKAAPEDGFDSEEELESFV